jgi:hypothetical protein
MNIRENWSGIKNEQSVYYLPDDRPLHIPDLILKLYVFMPFSRAYEEICWRQDIYRYCFYVDGVNRVKSLWLGQFLYYHTL